MPFPNYPDKYSSPAVLTAQEMIAFRRSLGRMPGIEPPEGVILCLQRGLPERLRFRYPLRRAGQLMGDLYLLRRSGGKAAVLTNFGIGASLIGALAEELIAWGVGRLVSISWAGGLQPDLPPGSIVVCERALRDEGTSHHYLPTEKYIHANVELVDNLGQALARRGIPHSIGATWTTDAPYRETLEEVRQYQEEGVKTVEMESAALLAVGQAHGVQAASICVVGDSLASLRWIAPTDVRPVEKGLEAAYGAAIEVLSGE